MDMKLFKVRVEYETVILAKDEDDAISQADYVIKNNDDGYEGVYVYKINDIDDLPSGWDGKCRPWGERDAFDRKIEEILQRKYEKRI